MRQTVSAAVMVSALAVTALMAQKTTPMHPGGGGSPHVRTEWVIEGANISIEYGRPYLKGRTIGKDIVQHGFIWRAGADEATTLKTDKPLVFGKLTVPAGTHTLWVMPRADKWELIFNKQTGQWGTSYDEAHNLGKVDMKLETLSPPADQHTFSIDKQGSGGLLKIEFGQAKATVPFTVAT
jgi:hypothetical protein